MGVKEAAVQVLREAGQSLHVNEIAKRILAAGLWQSAGKTPAATVAARLYADIKRNGDGSAFVKTGPQTFGLRGSGPAPDGGPHRAETETASRTRRRTYSFSDAAEKVLEQFGNKKPMHYREVTDKALELGMLSTEGQTPEATMYAQILTEIKRRQRRGDQPRFVMHGRGYVGLSRWMGHGLAFEIEQHNRRVRKELRKRLLKMEWRAFEELIAALLPEMGFDEIQLTPGQGDKGIDVRATLVVGDSIRIRMAVQVKRWKHNVQAPVVQQVRGSLGTHQQGLIVTTSDFTKGAREEAARQDAVPVALMNGEQLAATLASYGLGITRHAHEIFELAAESPTQMAPESWVDEDATAHRGPDD